MQMCKLILHATSLRYPKAEKGTCKSYPGHTRSPTIGCSKDADSIWLLSRALAQKYNMPMELAVALAGLALYDIVIFVDDSGEHCSALTHAGQLIL